MKFEKVSLSQFERDSYKSVPELQDKDLKEIYESIHLPRRATKGSAGYDFYSPFEIHIMPGESCVIPTAIRAEMPETVVLIIVPRSGLGVRYRMQLANTIGIIDSDYYNAENEGHIMITITNDSKEDKYLHISRGDRFVQGIFLPFLVCDGDTSSERRVGGFGSTNERVV